jgi:hypothetical protein
MRRGPFKGRGIFDHCGGFLIPQIKKVRYYLIGLAAEYCENGTDLIERGLQDDPQLMPLENIVYLVLYVSHNLPHQ